MTTLGAGLALIAASASFLPFFTLRPTRATTGAGVRLAEALPWASWLATALAAAAFVAWLIAAARGSTRAGFGASPARSAGASAGGGHGAAAGAPSAIMIALSVAAAPLALAALAHGSAALSANAGAMARVSFGPGFWTSLIGSWLAVRGASGLAGRPRSGQAPSIAPDVRGASNVAGRSATALAPSVALAAAIAAAVAISLAGGWADLAIARELASRQGRFVGALAEHLAYALFPTLAAAALGLPLGRAAARKPGLENALFSIATVAQTIPTLSLLGLLVVPLSALRAAVPALGAIGFSGVGWAPASIALFLYALLPILAHAAAGFSGVPREAIDAGVGAGMADRQLFLRVELPLAAPALIAGLRTAFAQNLGNATLAGLIGGGGLGGLVFLGLAQAAPDLILLGALPVVALAFAADRLLGLAEALAASESGVGEPDAKPRLRIRRESRAPAMALPAGLPRPGSDVFESRKEEP